MTLQANHTLRGSELEEFVEETFIFRFENEADIHAAAVFFLLDSSGEEFAVVNAVVEQVSFLLVAFVNPFNATVCLEPTHVEECGVDRQYGRCVEHRTTFNVCAIIQHGRDIAVNVTEALFFDNNEGNARRSDVLLCTTIDDVVFANVDRTAQNVGRHVSYETDIAFLLIDFLQLALGDLRTIDGVVGSDVHVVAVLRNFKVHRNGIGGSSEFDSFCAKYASQTFCLFEGFLGPNTGVEISCFLAHHVVGNHAELQAGTTTDEDNAVSFGYAKQFLHQSFRFVNNGLEILCAVRNLKDGKSFSLEIDNGISSVFDYLLRQDTGSCIEIVLFHTELFF